MARKFKKRQATDIEDIVAESLARIGVKNLSDEQVALLARLIFSGVARYFFMSPDNEIEMGFLKIIKNPDKEQLFAVNIRKSENEGIYNAKSLWKYYRGELVVEAELKSIMEEFVQNLLDYSQAQEQSISKLTRKIS